ncbi:hypothetical protein AGABI2DRAFT_122517 [Agaricus bisporus var. bisporus H97]|uniref:hypothetical protein n=1 Tax=Agaricus bisporus var. bisporus (strain H97 / ATCC MYA-4626 / FGSC 10389) TaxID=936046 RepID=UPI00029F7A42|nr:hypothetical protein AGABI2DRAFT_122517 [Agaricus bisporus var. bisporus H97]EKV42951.1 hypothetical protein AGABI2DRAFT_122517 [Agaricus bisporus var. bisporus H97]
MTQTNTVDTALVLANISSILVEVNEVLARLAAAVENLRVQLPPVYQGYTSQRLATAIENLSLQLPGLQEQQGSTETTSHAQATAPTAAVSTVSHEAPVTTTGVILAPAEVEARLANLPESTSFYVVARSLEPGVYDTLRVMAEASAYTTGVANASMRKVNIKSVALAHYATLNRVRDLGGCDKN